ncbi:hypothetical protein G7Y89_g10904 [Cudoniella acicularis]|uniref:HTH CENPB-type domain-containing protein n=1 Tax=Cudoniella acicularis TaxID=354080 RepID=A0A8H4VYB6_9HELO|nr:hypothetical protein G7Y89_g10904 [Cudoniella acicularis]
MARVDKSARIDAAVAALKRGEFTNYSNAATKYGCDRTSLSKRMRGLTKSKKEANSLWHQCLTSEQEEVLITRINSLTDRGMPPTSHIVKNLAEEIKGASVGKNWVGQFVKRHGIRLKSLYLRNIDNLRVSAEYAPMFILFFATLTAVIEKYRITAENIYNFDEKGFLIGLGRTLKRIITQEALKSGRVKKAKQDGSREFISILACISAFGKWIPPLLVYKGDLGDLQNTWVDDVTTKSAAHFTVSSNGWSNNAIGLVWLKQVFCRYTKPKRETQKRLLIVDGYSSHVNMAFINTCDKNSIIVLILPPHTTHRLQPLDVGLFQPLSTAYSWELE